jgi:hypothetical protein
VLPHPGHRAEICVLANRRRPPTRRRLGALADNAHSENAQRLQIRYRWARFSRAGERATPVTLNAGLRVAVGARRVIRLQ